MTNQSKKAPASACPKCGAEIREEKRSYYCQLAGPEATRNDLLTVCIHPDRLRKIVEGTDIKTEDDPCMECSSLAILVEDQGTLVKVDIITAGSTPSISEVHRCWRCSTVFTFRSL